MDVSERVAAITVVSLAVLRELTVGRRFRVRHGGDDGTAYSVVSKEVGRMGCPMRCGVARAAR